MKRKKSFLIIWGIMLGFLVACRAEDKVTNIYSFNGANDDFTINNGLIIMTEDMEKFIGGDLFFKNEKLLDAKDYMFKYSYSDSTGEFGILTYSSTINRTEKGQEIETNLGQISSKDLFEEVDVDFNEGSLIFSLKGELMNGESFVYDLTLDVKEVYKGSTKERGSQ